MLECKLQAILSIYGLLKTIICRLSCHIIINEVEFFSLAVFQMNDLMHKYCKGRCIEFMNMQHRAQMHGGSPSIHLPAAISVFLHSFNSIHLNLNEEKFALHSVQLLSPLSDHLNGTTRIHSRFVSLFPFSFSRSFVLFFAFTFISLIEFFFSKFKKSIWNPASLKVN